MVERLQSIIEYREIKTNKQSSIDNRVRALHTKTISILGDESYSIGHMYKLCRKLSDYDILAVADYAARKARVPGRAFVSITEKKLAAK